jgi:hypothetical protein
LGYRNPEQERNRTVIWRKPEVQAKPRKLFAVGMDRVVRRFRYIRDHFSRIAHRPSGIVEVRPGSGRVSGDGDPPAPIQNLRRAQPGSIEDCLIVTRRGRRFRLAPVRAEKPWMPLKSKALHRT